jgi:hypothetical protein
MLTTVKVLLILSMWVYCLHSCVQEFVNVLP